MGEAHRWITPQTEMAQDRLVTVPSGEAVSLFKSWQTPQWMSLVCFHGNMASLVNTVTTELSTNFQCNLEDEHKLYDEREV